MLSKFSCPDGSSFYKPHQARNRCWGFLGSAQVPKLSCSGFYLVSILKKERNFFFATLSPISVLTSSIFGPKKATTCRKITDKLTYMEDKSENPKSSFPDSSRLQRITVQSKGQESHAYVNTVNTADKSRKKNPPPWLHKSAAVGSHNTHRHEIPPTTTPP